MNEVIKGKCVSLSSEGKGIIKSDKKIIFVDSLLLGEEADVEIIYKKQDVYFGRIKKLYSFSNERITSLCPISTACGGCCFQNASYEYELKYKRNKVNEDLIRIGNIHTEVLPIIGADDPYYYRNKIQVPIGKDKNKIVYGFYRANTHKIIPFKSCFIEDKRSEKILSTFVSLMEKYKLAPYDEDNKTGIIRHLLIRTSSSTNEIMLVIVTNGENFPSRGKFIDELKKLLPEITTIIQNYNGRDTNVILGNQERVLFGNGYIEDELLGLKFKISPRSFFQINHDQCEKLYYNALSLANIKNTDVALDAYAGVCTLGLLASKYAKEVISVESEHSAVINGKYNAKMNNINNIAIIEDDCTKFINENKSSFDVVIMDPPRKGSTPEFLNALVNAKVKKIVYISCDPATLSRDLRYLVKYYDIKTVQPVDMFPRTCHVETIVALDLK